MKAGNRPTVNASMKLCRSLTSLMGATWLVAPCPAATEPSTATPSTVATPSARNVTD